MITCDHMSTICSSRQDLGLAVHSPGWRIKIPCFPVAFWRFPGLLLEKPGEINRIIVAKPLCDLLDVQAGVAQEIFCACDAECIHKIERSSSVGFLKQACEVVMAASVSFLDKIAHSGGAAEFHLRKELECDAHLLDDGKRGGQSGCGFLGGQKIEQEFEGESARGKAFQSCAVVEALAQTLVQVKYSHRMADRTMEQLSGNMRRSPSEKMPERYVR